MKCLFENSSSQKSKRRNLADMWCDKPWGIDLSLKEYKLNCVWRDRMAVTALTLMLREQTTYLIHGLTNSSFILCYFCCYPTPSEGWKRSRRPCSLRSRATPQRLDQRSLKQKESPKSERLEESVAGQCRIR